MITIPYRLLKVGDPNDPVAVFAIWREGEQFWLSDGNVSDALSADRSLESLRYEVVPAWIARQGHRLDMTPVAEIHAADAAHAHQLLMEAAARVDRHPVAARR